MYRCLQDWSKNSLRALAERHYPQQQIAFVHKKCLETFSVSLYFPNSMPAFRGCWCLVMKSTNRSTVLSLQAQLKKNFHSRQIQHSFLLLSLNFYIVFRAAEASSLRLKSPLHPYGKQSTSRSRAGLSVAHLPTCLIFEARDGLQVSLHGPFAY